MNIIPNMHNRTSSEDSMTEQSRIDDDVLGIKSMCQDKNEPMKCLFESLRLTEL